MIVRMSIEFMTTTPFLYFFRIPSGERQACWLCPGKSGWEVDKQPREARSSDPPKPFQN